jgi:hypothetical protein
MKKRDEYTHNLELREGKAATLDKLKKLADENKELNGKSVDDLGYTSISFQGHKIRIPHKPINVQNFQRTL